MLKKKHKSTLNAIFALLALNGRRAVFHKPHPRKEIDKGAVVSMKRFLIEAGVTSC